MSSTKSDCYWRYTDEVEKIQKAVMVKEVRKLLRYLYGKQILFAYRFTLKSRCNGCIIDHPSQDQHMCLESLDDCIASELYLESEARVNKQFLNLVFIESSITLWLNYSVIDFDSTLQEFLQCWIDTDFQDLNASQDVEDSFVTVSIAAAMKIRSLEERFTK